jgi:hypothetical protein
MMWNLIEERYRQTFPSEANDGLFLKRNTSLRAESSCTSHHDCIKLILLS